MSNQSQRAEAKAVTGWFSHPAEYLAAMKAIGWQPLAMFQRLPDGSAHCMGVIENPRPDVDVIETWEKFHAIQMRAPVQSTVKNGGWWREVWQHLYDQGLGEDVTPPVRGGSDHES